MTNQMRVLLDEEAFRAIETMLEELNSEGECLKINSSRLVSWIICKFSRDYYRNNFQVICQDHFNSKLYLKRLAQNLSATDDLEQVLKETLQRIKPSKIKNAQKVLQQEAK